MSRRAAMIGFTLLAFGAGSSLAGCGRMSGGVAGSGIAKTETRSVSAVTDVELDGVGTLEITGGAGPSLTITADDNIAPLIAADVSGDTLRIHPKSDVRPKTKLVYKLALPKVSAVTVSGAADLAGHALRGDALKITINGSGSVKLDGDVGRLELIVRGAGDADALGLAAKDVSVNVSGAGDADVNARDSLDVDVSGAGSVRYKGSPKLRKSVSGVGSVRPLG